MTAPEIVEATTSVASPASTDREQVERALAKGMTVPMIAAGMDLPLATVSPWAAAWQAAQISRTAKSRYARQHVVTGTIASRPAPSPIMGQPKVPAPKPRARLLLALPSECFTGLPQFAVIARLLHLEGYQIRPFTAAFHQVNGTIHVRMVWRRRADGGCIILQQSLVGVLPSDLLDDLMDTVSDGWDG